ncbi:hypothetical protein OHA72_18165 [Dactylosporangium sp. NBC_01737]|uniref:fascin domain-containing protein n=1 Tax=Dactylosporangium sp. NBC_01737 TaxID=2975959 RepID=UPI002E0E02F3|nr:hypothetical protein OHA72_18165 [Dactylosporangium sp. NBC_01737]
MLSAAVVLAALLGTGTAHAEQSAAPPGATAEDDPATKGLTRTPLDLGGGDGVQQLNALGPASIPGASICRRYYIFSYRAGRYVSEEQGYTGSSHNMLRARSSAGALGTWEQFSICSYNGRTDLIFIQASSGYLVTAEYGYAGNSKGMLRGRGEWPGDWEVFEVWSDNGRYFLRNQATQGWVSVRVDLTGSSANMLRGNGGSAGPWEQLAFTSVA